MIWILILLWALSDATVPTTLSPVTANQGKRFGNQLLTVLDILGTTYLLVSEKKSSNADPGIITFYSISSSAIAKVSSRSGLANEYSGMATDGFFLFIADEGTYTSKVYNIYRYSIASLISTTVSLPMATGNDKYNTTSSSYYFGERIAATYVTSTSKGYVAATEPGKVHICSYSGRNGACSAYASPYTTGTTGERYVAFAPGSSVLAIGDPSAGSKVGKIYLVDVSTSPVTLLATIDSPSNAAYDAFGQYIAMSSTTLYASAQYGAYVYSFTLSGSTTPTSTIKSGSCYRLSLSSDSSFLVCESSSYWTSLSVAADGKLSLYGKQSKSDGAAVATRDYIFWGDTSHNNYDGIVNVNQNVPVTPTASPTSALSDYTGYVAFTRYSSLDCSGPINAWGATRATPIMILVYAAMTGCHKASDGTGTYTTSVGLTSLYPVLPKIPGIAVSFYRTSDCSPNSWDRITISSPSCTASSDGSFDSSTCDAANYYGKKFSDSKCTQQIDNIITKPQPEHRCARNSDGTYTSVSCIVGDNGSPPATDDKTPTSLGIGLGVGLGGAAIAFAAGGYAFYLQSLKNAATVYVTAGSSEVGAAPTTIELPGKVPIPLAEPV